MQKIPPNGLSSLAPAAQAGMAQWHRFIKTSQESDLRPLLADGVVFHSPFSYAPMPGRDMTTLVLTTVANVFENFRYARQFSAGPHDAVLEFEANVGRFDLQGVDLIAFDDAGLIVDFAVMIRPAKALQAVGEQMITRIGPQLMQMKA